MSSSLTLSQLRPAAEGMGPASCNLQRVYKRLLAFGTSQEPNDQLGPSVPHTPAGTRCFVLLQSAEGEGSNQSEPIITPPKKNTIDAAPTTRFSGPCSCCISVGAPLLGGDGPVRGERGVRRVGPHQHVVAQQAALERATQATAANHAAVLGRIVAAQRGEHLRAQRLRRTV